MTCVVHLTQFSIFPRNEAFIPKISCKNSFSIYYIPPNFDCIKLQRFCTNELNATKIRKEVESWETIFIARVSDKGLISKIFRELNQIYKNTSNSSIDKWSQVMNRQFSEEEIKAIYSHLKKCSKSLLIREMQMKTTLRYHCTLIKLANVTKNKTNVGGDVRKPGH